MVQKGLSLLVPGQAPLPYAGTGTVYSAAQQGDTCVVRTYWCDTIGKKRTSSDDDVISFRTSLLLYMFVCVCVFPCSYIIFHSTIQSYYYLAIFSSSYLPHSFSFLSSTTLITTTLTSLHRTTYRFLGVNNEKDMLLAVKSGATAVLTDRVNWAVPFIKNNALRFQDIVT